MLPYVYIRDSYHNVSIKCHKVYMTTFSVLQCVINLKIHIAVDHFGTVKK